jgi:uncharacterized SAM-binding protein YcdF (DUF218 family)
MGLEPTTPCLQSRCSSQLSYVPERDSSCYGLRSYGWLPTLGIVLRSLVDPLWLPLVVLLALWVTLWRRNSLRRWMKGAGTIALGSLWLVSTPLGTSIVEGPLDVESRIEAGWTPDYIYVLSAGYDLGDQPEFDSSGVETVRRVNKAVELSEQYPTAKLVMAGSQPGMDGLRDPQQQGILMQAQAERLGVPAERIIIESISTNTNGHAKVAHESGLHQPDSPLLIVTSDFHLRRARREFSRYFDNIRMVGSDPRYSDGSSVDISLRTLFPNVDSLGETTLCLREYVALALSDIRN